jgi:hypothetical protein
MTVRIEFIACRVKGFDVVFKECLEKLSMRDFNASVEDIEGVF